MSEVEPLCLPDMSSRLVPGVKVFIILHKDPLRERIDVRISEVLGLEEDVLFLAQTEPPVPRTLASDTLEVALLLTEGGGLRPVGYAARLLDVREDYPGPDHTHIQALALTAPRPEEFFETSLRMHYRVPVDDDMGVLIRLEPPASLAAQEGPAWAQWPPAEAELPEALEGFETTELLDFSAGGARVRVAGTAQVEVGSVLPFKLLFLGSGYADGDGVVRSVEPDPDGQTLTLGLFFTNMEIRDIRYLERMVARIVSASRQRERDAEYS